jgi:hypothetical protein
LIGHLLFLSLAMAAEGGVVDRIAATVNDKVITQSEIYEIGGDYIQQRCAGSPASSCAREMEFEVLDALIKRDLIRDELLRLQMRVTTEEIDAAINQAVRDGGFADRQALREEYERQDIRWDFVREDIANRLRLQRFQQRVLLPRVTVSEDEVLDAYQRTARGEREVEVELEALGILVPADAEQQTRIDMVAQAAELVQAINAEEIAWADAVAQYDGAGLNDIVTGRTYEKGDLDETLDGVVFTAEIGVTQPPILVGEVLFVLRVVKKALGESKVVAFEEVEERLRMQIFQEKVAEAEEEWYQRARRGAHIDVLLQDVVQ